MGGRLQRQPGLADPAGPGQRHYPRLAQRGRGLLQLALPADERAHRQWQIAGGLRDRNERRELGREADVGQLVEQLRPGQIA